MMQKAKQDLLAQLSQIKKTKLNLTSLCDIIDDADIAIEKLRKKEFELKKELINQVHITKEGLPRTIRYNKEKDLWETKLPNKKRIYSKTEESLIDKLMQYYNISVTDFSMRSIFTEALAHKDRTSPVNQETLYHLQKTYDRFIDDEMSSRDIRTITTDILQEYTLNYLRKAQTTDRQGITHKVKKKAYLDYKSILNIIFNYSLNMGYIQTNPLARFSNKAFLKECDCSRATSEEKIFSEDEINAIKEKVRTQMNNKRYKGYFINGYAILFSILTGVRAGEIPSLKWSDINWEKRYIHIHSQQLSNKRNGKRECYLANWTKDEKGVPNGGRKFPLYDEVNDLLCELKNLQEDKQIKSEFIFCKENGEWISCDSYMNCLRRTLASMNLKATNNHAFRMSLNSNVLEAKLNLPPAKRAQILGHSVTTNLCNYTFGAKNDIGDLINAFNDTVDKTAKFHVVAPRSPLNSQIL